jgi:hypothetical protein
MTSSKRTVAFPERDMKMLFAVAECGALTAAQLSLLFFPQASANGKQTVHSNCQLRLKLLRQHGLLRRVEQSQFLTDGRQPYLYALTKNGARMLASWLQCEIHDLPWREKDSRLSKEYVQHLIATNNVRIAILCAVRNTSNVTLTKWLDELTLKSTHSADKITLEGSEGSKYTAALIPDGYFSLRVMSLHERPYNFFLEIDRATETGNSSDDQRRTWKRKIKLYLEYFRGEERSMYYARYGTYTGRVLTVTTSERRLANLKRWTEEVGGKQRFWFTTLEQTKPEAVLNAPIWQLAQEDGRKSLLEDRKK